MNKKRALITASVASMIDLFSMDNIHILQEQGFEVDVASNFAFGSITSQERVDAFRTELEKEGIRVIHMPIPRSIFDIKNIVCAYRQMKRLIEQEKYDLVHTQSPIGGVITRLGAKKVRKDGTKVLYTAHGFHFFKGAPVINWLLYYPIERLLAKFTDVLITINQEDYNRAKKFSAGQVCYVPGIGVDIEKFQTVENNREELRKKMKLDQEDFVWISVGQLSKRKNQITAIRAMGNIKEPHMKYLVVGLGEMEEMDKALVKELNLSDRVFLLGYRENVNELLQVADAFLFPSLQEGLPVSLMEAMAVGLPIVASKIRGNTDLISDGVEGYLVESKDVLGYADSMMKIYRNREQSKLLGECAQKRVQDFSRTNVYKELKKIYTELS